MPTAALRPCAFSRCAALVSMGVQYCPTHAKARNAERRRVDTSTSLYNDRRWRAFSKQWLATHPLCEQCTRDGRVTAGAEVDHIEPHKGDVQKFWAGPFQTLCTSCHSRKTATSEGAFGR